MVPLLAGPKITRGFAPTEKEGRKCYEIYQKQAPVAPGSTGACVQLVARGSGGDIADCDCYCESYDNHSRQHNGIKRDRK